MENREESGIAVSEPEGGLWQTTQLDSTIGDLQRGGADPSSAVPAAAAAEGGDEAADNKLGAKKKRRRRPRIVPSIRVYRGTFIHSTRPDAIEVLPNWLLGVDGGKIVFSEKAENYPKILDEYKLADFETECVIMLEEGTFMMPGFVDTHTHVVPYLVAGLLLDPKDGDGAKVDGLKDRRRTKLNLIADDRIANETFYRFIQHSLRQGITCASYNGSYVESAARLLTDTIVRCKQRAQVGLEMFYGDNRDDTHMFQMIKAKDVINHIVRKKNDLIQPCLVFSKPLPEWMETKIAELAQQLDLPMKTIIGDFPEDEIDSGLRSWIGLGQKHLLQYHRKCGVLNSRLIIVNGSLCSSQDLKLIASSGVSISYCPSASLLNCTFSSLSRFTSKHITIGLGTDINTSHCVSMLDTIRRCIQCTILDRRLPSAMTVVKETAKDKKVNCSVIDAESHSSSGDKTEEVAEDVSEKEEEEDEDDPECVVDVSLMRLFHMATLGGATAIGLGNKIGNFEVGKEFDAIHINPNVPSSKFMVLRNHDSILEILEKFLTVGDDRNVIGVYVKGERII